MNLFCVVFCSFGLLLNLMSKLIHNRWTCKLSIKTTVYNFICVHANKQLGLCFYVVVYHSVIFDVHLWKLSQKSYSTSTNNIVKDDFQSILQGLSSPQPHSQNLSSHHPPKPTNRDPGWVWSRVSQNLGDDN